MFPHDFARPLSVGSEAEIAALPHDIAAVLVVGLSDSKAGALGALSSLRCLLSDGNPSITDAGMEALSRLTTLEALDLEWAIINDAGLLHLARLSRLRWLDLSFCRGFSESGLHGLRAALPNCAIECEGHSAEG